MAPTGEYFAALTTNELTAGNDLLDDQAALRAFWDEHGYLFLRDVLDRSALAVVRDVIGGALTERGLADRTGEEVVTTGRSPADLPRYPDEIYGRRPAQAFVATPSVRGLFEKVLGEEPF